jgi:hypothetical protein
MTSTEYIRSLEKKVSELEALLGRPSEAASARAESQPEASSSEQPSESMATEPPDDVIGTIVGVGKDRQQPSLEQELDPHAFGGLSLLGRVHKLCQHVSGMQQEDASSNFQDDELVSGFEMAPPESNAPIAWEAFALLPARSQVEAAIDIVVREACTNMQFMDRQELNGIMDDVYQDIDDETTDGARKPLALLYGIMALSRQYHPVAPPENGRKKAVTLNGYVIELRDAAGLADNDRLTAYATSEQVDHCWTQPIARILSRCRRSYA